MAKCPTIKFEMLTKEENIRIIKEIANFPEEEILDLRNRLIVRFLDMYNILNKPNKEELIEKLISKLYDEEVELLPKKIKKYRIRWHKENEYFMYQLESYLHVDWPPRTKEIKCYVGLIPDALTDLENMTMYLDCNLEIKSAKFKIANSLCQFLYYEKWCKIYPSSNYEDFKYPSLVWQLSQISTDPILNSNVLNKAFDNLDFNYKTYDYFYNDDNIKIMNEIKEIYMRDEIKLSIPNSYNYLVQERGKNEKETKYNIWR